jgi:hypothetical protein
MARAGVEPLLHLHDRITPVSAVAGQHRALDRRRAAPARQQRGVDVEAAEPRRVQDRLWQDEAIGDDDGDVGARARRMSPP